MSVVLSEHLPLLGTAPDGIQKLRGLILELAVRGKLVPQDSNAEPASELLKRIAQERTRIEAEGICRKSKALPPVGEDEQPYSLPDGWTWVRLSEIGHDWGQKTPDVDFTYVDVSAIDNARGIIDSPSVVSPVDAPSRARKIVRRGTVIYSTVRPYLLNIAVIDRDLTPAPIASTAFAVIHPLAGLSSRYIFWYLRSPVFVRYVESVQTGIAYPAINDGQFFSGVFPLPPLAEQHRIVAKVDELMALCDRLEAEQADAEAAHAKLVDTLLGTLTQSTDAADLAANWQRLAERFGILFTTESSLDALKQTILQLAVMGKLVPQDPNDEPASELLKRIAQERARLEAEGDCKKSKPVPPVREDERPFEVPAGWEWERIGNYVLQTDYGLSEKTVALNDGVPVLKMGDIQGGNVILGGQKAVPPTTEGLPYLLLEPDDLLYNRTNSAELVGKTGIFRGQPQRFSFASYLIRIRCAKGMVSPTFLNLAMNAPMFRETEIVPHLKQQCGQANVNGTILRNMRIPVPPAAEQHRIVAKVDELMALCDRLKADLADSRRRQERLASTLIESALKAA